MDIDEPESERGGGDDGVQMLLGATVESEHSLDKRGQVFGARTDMIGNRRAGLAVVLADEPAVMPQAQRHETRVADHDALQSTQLLQSERRTPGLADRPSPTLDAILRRPFAFDHVAGF